MESTQSRPSPQQTTGREVLAWSEAGHPRRWLVLGVTSLGLFVVVLGNSVLSVALPAIATDLRAGSAQMQWYVDAYLLVFAALLLVGGAAGDRFGRRRAFVTGLVVLAAASAATAVIGTGGAVVLGRGVMGLGAALVMPATLALVNAVFPPAEKAVAMAAWTIVASVAIAAGPSAGGWVLSFAPWQAVFWTNVPVAVVAVVLAGVIVPEVRASGPTPALDLVGAGLSVVSMGLVVVAVIGFPHRGADPVGVLLPLAGGVLGGIAFLAWELRVPSPMLPLALFRDPRFSAASAAVALGNFALMGLVFFYTIYMQLGLGHTALETGVRIIPSALAIVAFSVWGARIHGRRGARLPVSAGLAAISLALLTLSQVSAGHGYPVVLMAQLLLGAGLGLSGPAATASMMSAMPPDRSGVASAVNDAAREVGALLGVAVMGSVLSARYSAALVRPTAHLPEEAAAALRSSLAGVAETAARLPAADAEALRVAAVRALEAGIGAGALVGAGVAAVGLLVALRHLPSGNPPSTPPT